MLRFCSKSEIFFEGVRSEINNGITSKNINLIILMLKFFEVYNIICNKNRVKSTILMNCRERGCLVVWVLENKKRKSGILGFLVISTDTLFFN